MRSLSLFSVALASTLICTQVAAQDLCSQISGHWSGSFTFKNNKDCLQYGKCTYDFTADVTFLNGVTYQVNLKSDMKDQFFSIQCLHNKITSPFLAARGRIFSQDRNFYAEYEDARLTVNLQRITQ